MWTKLGDEFGDEAWSLSDAAFRTHVEALMWSNRLGLDGMIPKRHFRKFTFSTQAEQGGDELIRTGWWKDTGDFWDIGLRFPEWQLEREVVESRRAAAALRQRRHRLHKAGNHSLCLGQNCPGARAVTRDKTRDRTRDTTRDPGRVGSGRGNPSHPSTSRQDTRSKP
jgi:hypothetical protein